jgi:hypothetical protein
MIGKPIGSGRLLACGRRAEMPSGGGPRRAKRWHCSAIALAFQADVFGLPKPMKRAGFASSTRSPGKLQVAPRGLRCEILRAVVVPEQARR